MIRGLILAGAVLLAAAPAASASEVAYDDAGVLVLTAAPGEQSLLGIWGGSEPGTVQLYDSGVAVTALPAACEDNRDWGSVTCPAPEGVRVDLGDGDDIARAGWGIAVPVAVAGGLGDDLLEGDEGDDALDGGPGNDEVNGFGGADVVEGGDGADELDGGAGPDRLAAGPGDDLLRLDGYESPSADVADGGPGFDQVANEWGDRRPHAPPAPLTVTLGGDADDGRAGEGDDLQGIEAVYVHNPGRFVGTDADEHLESRQVLSPVELVGAGGADILKSGDGPDQVDGGAGDDALDAGFGDDHIVAGPGSDRVWADRAGGDCGPVWCRLPWGNDVVDVRDGEVDSVDCGRGQDRVAADPDDVVAEDCEVVERAATARTPRSSGRPSRARARAGHRTPRGPRPTARRSDA